MGIYGPDVEGALEAYSSQFDDLKTAERQTVFDLNAINPLSDLREDWENCTTTPTEHLLQTAAGTDETALLQTDKRGQYTAGYESIAGVGFRLPSLPQNDEVYRKGYYTIDANGDPLNGWYLGVDSDGLFVSEVRNGNKNIVRQENWNKNTADGTDDAATNPSEEEIDVSKGVIIQFGFVYYGYGPVTIDWLSDNGVITLHEFYHDGQTSVENTNLPITAQIISGGTNADATELYIGGRQFSTIGPDTRTPRAAGQYVDEVSADDTAWTPVVSVRLKDGTDIGSVSYEHILGTVDSLLADTDANTYRWQIRHDTVPDAPLWEAPSTHADTPSETAMKVDISSTSITDGNGDLTGVFLDGGTLTAGEKNKATINTEAVEADISDGKVVTLIVQASPNSSGTVSEIFLKWKENW